MKENEEKLDRMLEASANLNKVVSQMESVNKMLDQTNALTSIGKQTDLLNTAIGIKGLGAALSVHKGIASSVDYLNPVISTMIDKPSWSAYTKELTLASTVNLGISRIANSFSSVHDLSAIKNINTIHNMGAVSSFLETYRSLSYTKPDSFNTIIKGLSLQDNKIDSLLGTFSLSTEFGKSLQVAKEFSLLSSSILQGFNWNDFSTTLSISEKKKKQLFSSFIGFNDNYLKLYKSFEILPDSFKKINPSITKLIPEEHYATTIVVQKISNPELEISSEDKESQERIIVENEIVLARLLPRLNKNLLTTWQGAVQAIDSVNIDATRHFMISARELLTHSLHLMSPDVELKAWSKNKNDFANGNPTRKARLRYICRGIDNDKFDKFIDSDIASTIKLLDILNKETHKIDTNQEREEKIKLKLKLEALLKFLLVIHFSEN